MKLISFLSLSAVVTAALAQRAGIGAPANGTTVHRGSKITVEIDRPDTLTGSTEVGIVIALHFCGASAESVCQPPEDVLGTILYNGKFKPAFHTGVAKTSPPKFYRHNSVHHPSWKGATRFCSSQLGWGGIILNVTLR
ncbi:hypothetical protein B0H14DRAFT_2833230 [Mycena olivaceomarginata]|nr:hypothetical protein B0H14DRAFT_2833230 [Mycena olivaceomarginata]